MTHRERFHRVLSFDTAVQVPNYELCCWGQTVERWLVEGLPQDTHLAQTGDFFWGEPCFGLDGRGFALLDIGMRPAFAYEVLAEDDRYVTARHTNGILTRALKEGTVRGTRMSMDQYLEFPVTDRASFARLKERYDPHDPARYPEGWVGQVAAWRERDYPVGLLGNATFGLYSQLRSWVGTEHISYLFHDDPAFVEEMVGFNTDFLLALVEPALQQVEFDFFNFFEDFAGKGGPLLSPATFRRFFLPSYRRIIERFRQAGITSFWLDSDGDPQVLIPLMLEAGITCLWPLEQASGMDPLRLRREYGRDLALFGAIDKRELTKDRAAVEREVHAKLPPLLESGGYFPCLDHAFPPDISYENFCHYIELKARLLERG